MQNNLFRWPKWSTDQGSQANHGNGGTHGQVSISASGTAVHKHVRQHIRFSQENTWLKVHKNESVQSISCNPWNPCQHFRAFLSTCFGILDKNSNFMDKNFVSIPTLSSSLFFFPFWGRGKGTKSLRRKGGMLLFGNREGGGFEEGRRGGAHRRWEGVAGGGGAGGLKISFSGPKCPPSHVVIPVATQKCR